MIWARVECRDGLRGGGMGKGHGTSDVLGGLSRALGGYRDITTSRHLIRASAWNQHVIPRRACITRKVITEYGFDDPVGYKRAKSVCLIHTTIPYGKLRVPSAPLNINHRGLD